jgi:hypothetical protein
MMSYGIGQPTMDTHEQLNSSSVAAIIKISAN